MMTAIEMTFASQLRARLDMLGAPKHDTEILLFSEVGRQLMRADQTRSQLSRVRGYAHADCMRIIGEAEGTADGVLYAIESFRTHVTAEYFSTPSIPCETRPTRICVWWRTPNGAFVGKRYYQNNSEGWTWAKKRVAKLVAEGYMSDIDRS